MTNIDDIPVYSHRELKRVTTGIALVGYIVGVVFGAGITFVFAVSGKLPL
jgi:hypothetical protein